MKPPPFDYDRPATVDEALSLLERYGDDTKLLAGGQSLVPLLNFRLARPERLIDLNPLHELAFVRAEADGLHIGAMTRTAELERSQAVADLCPILAEAAAHVGHFQIRNRGTVGGSVAHADPSAELPAALIATGASFHLRSAWGSRTVAAEDFFYGVFTTALAPNELLTEIDVPVPASGSHGAFEEFARRSGDFALGAVACQVSASGGTVSTVSLVSVGVGQRPARLEGAEQALIGTRPDAAAVRDAVTRDLEASAPASDPYARKVVTELAARACMRALSQAQLEERHGA